MKNKIFIRVANATLFVLLLVAGCFFSCQMPEVEIATTSTKPVGPSSSAFYAHVEGAENAETSTKVYTDEQLHVLWNADDYISIFAKTSLNKKFRFTGLDGASGGYFEDFDNASTGFGTGSPIGFNYAVFPYHAESDYVFDDIIRTVFPREQFYLANSFGRDANLMVAKSSDNDLFFKNVGGYLCIKLYGEAYSVRSIILKGNVAETLSGPVKLSFDTENIPSLTFDAGRPDDLRKEIVLKTASPVALGSTAETAASFWMVVPPMDFASGFTITIIDDKGGVHEKRTDKSFRIERSKLLTMKAFEVKNEAFAPLPQGIWPFSGTAYVFDKTTDQINIAEVGGESWARFLLTSTLTMYEIGPIPANAAVGMTFDATLATYVSGNQATVPVNLRLTVQSMQGGMMSLVSDEGDRYVFRF